MARKAMASIIGRDLMKELKISIDFDTEEVTFEDQAIPFHTRDQPVHDTRFANEPESDSDSDSADDIPLPLIRYWDPNSSNNESKTQGRRRQFFYQQSYRY